jgi:hypothetical protein
MGASSGIPPPAPQERAPDPPPGGRSLTDSRHVGSFLSATTIERSIDEPVHRPSAVPRARVSWPTAMWLFVAVGVVVRVLQYGANRSLSIDESYLALNVIQKSPAGLLHGLAFTQAAPLGFLEAQKLSVFALGRGEYALRLLPLCVSLASLVVFSLVARRLLKPLAAIVAVAVVALLDPLVYYSSTGKQYAFDAAATVLVIGAAARAELGPTTRLERLLLAPVGATLIWFSHASIFLLAGLGAMFAFSWVRARERALAADLVLMAATWIGSFAIEYRLSEANFGRIIGAFESGHARAFPSVGSGSGWFDATTDRLRYLVGLEDTASGFQVLISLPSWVNRSLTIAVAGLVAVGVASFLRSHPRLTPILLVPVSLALIASGLHHYPLAGRTLLFVLPLVAICAGEGVAALRRLGRIPVAAALACVATIGLLPAQHLVSPRENEEMKQALSYLDRHRRPGDGLYLSKAAQYAFAYYHLCGCSRFDPGRAWRFSTVAGGNDGQTAVVPRAGDIVVQSSDASETKRLLHRRRVWILTAELPASGRNELLVPFSNLGTFDREFHASGPHDIAASLYLWVRRVD